MGDILVNTADYNAVRVRLGVTTDDLPDSDITTIGMLSIAEALIESLVTDWAAIMAGPPPNKTFLQAAAVALVGAFSVRKLELQRGQSFSQVGYSESATKVNWDALRCELLEESQSYLLLISTHTPSAAPKLMVAAGPTSSASAWPTRVEQWAARIQPHLATWLETGGVRRFGWENQP